MTAQKEIIPRIDAKPTGKIKSIVWFEDELRVNGGGERLILEGLKFFEGEGLESTLVVHKPHKRHIYDGKYRPRIVSLLGQEFGVFKKVFRRLTPTLFLAYLLRKKLNEIKPDIVIVQAQWGEAIPLYYATLFSRFCYAAYIFDSIFTYKAERSRHALIFRKNFEEVKNSFPAYIENASTPLKKLTLRKRWSIQKNAVLRYLSVRKAKAVLVFSKQNGWEVNKFYGKDAFVAKGAFRPSIFLHKCSTDIRKELQLENKRIALSICRLQPKKRIDLCIRAFSEISKTDSDLVLVIGGEGPEEHSLKQLVEELGVESKVHFLGYVSEELLWDYYQSADLFVHMDLADFDIAPFEALALGTKVIWSTEMEVDEVLAGNELLFVADPNVADVVKEFRAALKSKPLVTKTKNREIMARYTWDEYFRRILAELGRTLSS